MLIIVTIILNIQLNAIIDLQNINDENTSFIIVMSQSVKAIIEPINKLHKITKIETCKNVKIKMPSMFNTFFIIIPSLLNTLIL